jgi:hypothetical protein
LPLQKAAPEQGGPAMASTAMLVGLLPPVILRNFFVEHDVSAMTGAVKE